MARILGTDSLLTPISLTPISLPSKAYQVGLRITRQQLYLLGGNGQALPGYSRWYT